MMGDHGKSRVQGSWAGRPVRRKPDNKNKSSEANHHATGTTSSMKWAGKQSASSTNNEFPQFKNVDTLTLKEVPPEKVIKHSGEYCISESANGKSMLIFVTDFLDKENADWMLETLRNELPWEQKKNHFQGKQFVEPRLTSWFSEFPYKYSGVTQGANPHWHPLATALRDRVNGNYGLRLDSLLANLYRDGHDSVDWHTDAEPALGKCPPIASLSLGDTRNFELREIDPTNANAGDYTYSRKIRVPLTHGSLLLMLGSTQHDWQHRIPKEYHDRSARVNLTFRTMHPDHVTPLP